MDEIPDPLSLPNSVTDTGAVAYALDEHAAALHMIDAVGAVLSTSSETAADVATLPAVSTARAVTVAVPSDTVVESQFTTYGALLAVPTVWPLTRKSTCATPYGELAAADNATVPLTAAPFPGAFMPTAI